MLSDAPTRPSLPSFPHPPSPSPSSTATSSPPPSPSHFRRLHPDRPLPSSPPSRDLFRRADPVEEEHEEPSWGDGEDEFGESVPWAQHHIEDEPKSAERDVIDIGEAFEAEDEPDIFALMANEREEREREAERRYKQSVREQGYDVTEEEVGYRLDDETMEQNDLLQEEDFLQQESHRYGSAVLRKVIEIARLLKEKDMSPAKFLSVIQKLAHFAILGTTDEEELALRKHYLITSEAIDLFVKALGRYVEVEQVQLTACTIMSELTRTDPRTRKALGKAGAPSILTKVLAHHMDQVQLVNLTMTVLHFIVTDDDNRKLLSATQSIDTCITAMRRHAYDFRIQQSGLLFLASCACENEENRLSCVDKAGIEAVVDAMATHSDDKTIQRRACIALRNFVWRDLSVKMQVIDKKGLIMILNALDRFMDCKDIVHHGTLAIYNIFTGIARERSAQLGADTTLMTILKIMKVHGGAGDLQVYLLRTLGDAVTIPDVAEMLVNVGALKIVVDVVKRNASDKEIVGSGCKVLRQLAQVPKGREELKKCGGPRTLLDFLLMVCVK